MPFLNEELPFLAEFDGYPEVSVQKAFNVLETSITTAAIAKTAFAAKHDMGAFRAPEVSFEDLITSYGPLQVVSLRVDSYPDKLVIYTGILS
ncbi:hypothetical protein KCU77_g4031, partial [Aureobasidium melanogenum]